MSMSLQACIMSDNGSENKYAVRINDCGSTYARKLYDVDGFVLMDETTGDFLHVYTRLMKDAFDSGRLRVIHNVREGYVYFITNDEQSRRFQEERKEGSDIRGVTYYVYMDKE